jgi:hypothetical protein
MKALADRLSVKNRVTFFPRQFPRGFFGRFKAYCIDAIISADRLLKNDILIVHSALFLSFTSIVFAKVLRKKVIGFVWDVYPDSFRYSRAKKSPLALKIISVVERSSYEMCDTLIVPHAGYLPFVRSRRQPYPRVIPLWPISPPLAVYKDGNSNSINIVFAGQLSNSRGLSDTISNLAHRVSSPVTLHLFSSDSLPPRLLDAAKESDLLSIKYHGHVSADLLPSAINRFDFGLVSLEKTFDLPAFPSKIMTYLSAGLPILYNGPKNPDLENMIEQEGIGIFLDRVPSLDAEIVSSIKRNFRASRERFLQDINSRISEIDQVF